MPTSTQPPTSAEPAAAAVDPEQAPQTTRAPVPVLVGELTRDQILAALESWNVALEHAHADATASAALAHVPSGATVTVYLGTWCGDSRRELARFWKALDVASGEVPFTIRLIGVDRAKQAPGDLLAIDLAYVPTFVVSRRGHEVGRIVESAPLGLETSLLALLKGDIRGVISGRAELSGQP